MTSQARSLRAQIGWLTREVKEYQEAEKRAECRKDWLSWEWNNGHCFAFRIMRDRLRRRLARMVGRKR